MTDPDPLLGQREGRALGEIGAPLFFTIAAPDAFSVVVRPSHHLGDIEETPADSEHSLTTWARVRDWTSRNGTHGLVFARVGGIVRDV